VEGVADRSSATKASSQTPKIFVHSCKYSLEYLVPVRGCAPVETDHRVFGDVTAEILMHMLVRMIAVQVLQCRRNYTIVTCSRSYDCADGTSS